MAKKLDTDALFEEYAALGPARSYEALAQRHDVSKRSITRIATRDGWQAMIAEREARTRAEVEKRTIETHAAVRARHLKMVRVVESKALEVLKRLPLATARDAIHAIATAVRIERELMGDAPVEVQSVAEEVIEKVRQERKLLYQQNQEKGRLIEIERVVLREKAKGTEENTFWDGSLDSPDHPHLHRAVLSASDPEDAERPRPAQEPDEHEIGYDPFEVDVD